MMPPYIIAFTGTQHGMTFAQQARLRQHLDQALADHGVVQFHHGDCIGADAQAHDIAVEVLGVEAIWIHPGDVPAKRAHKHSPHVMPERPTLARNRKMVALCNELVAAPLTGVERLRSGTWMTVREARDRQHRAFTVLKP